MKYTAAPLLQKVGNIVKDAALKAKKRHLDVYTDEIKCKSGCNHCCSRPIMISIAEAHLIKESLIKQKRWSEVKRRSMEQEKHKDIDALTWFQMNIKCPVLDPNTGKCLAYEVRPIVCSTHYVVSNPSSCDPWSAEPIKFNKANMGDIEDAANDEINKTLGQSIYSTRLTMFKALNIIDKLVERDGLTLDQVMVMIGRETS